MDNLPDRDLEGWDVAIVGCQFDEVAGTELVNARERTIVIHDCYVVKRNRFWRWVAVTALSRAAHCLSFGLLGKGG